MSVIKGNHAGSAGGDFYSYEINQSLRFNDGDSAYLSKSFGSNGNLKKFTLSFWFKISILGTDAKFLGSSYTSSSEFAIRIEDTGELNYYSYAGGGASANYDLTTTRKFRDSNAWYHMVFVWDTAQSTAADRVKIYINGVQETVFSNAVYPAQDYSGIWNLASHTFYIGGTQYYDGYLAEFHHLDGIAGDPTSLGLGETKDGVWIPKSYSGSHGTNGFYLPFDDSSAIGDDESANTNDWTVNNLAATDVVLDSPTNNFAVLNNLVPNAATYSEGNLKITTSSNWESGGQSIPVSSGKWYAEFIASSTSALIGVEDFDAVNTWSVLYFGSTANGVGYWNAYGGQLYKNNSYSSYAGSSYGSTDIVGVHLDMDNKYVYFSINGAMQNSGNPASGSSGTGGEALSGTIYVMGGGNYTGNLLANFGQDSSFAGAKTAQGNADANGKGDFYYSPSSGYLALCTANLPDPTIGPTASTLANDHFNTVLYTGNDTARSITGVGFQPDWVWLKRRDATGDNNSVFDVVRGVQEELVTNSTSIEADDSTLLTAFGSDGFSIGTNSGINGDTKTFVSWNWKAGGSASSNSDGSVTSTVSANTSAGFSIVGWQGNETNSTIGHGLTQAPEAIIVKSRGSTEGWYTYHASVGNTKRLLLNAVNSEYASVQYWNNTTPTSTVFTVGINDGTNDNGYNMIAYCFHSVEGYSKFGGYSGLGSSGEPFIYTGFRPAWVMIKSNTNGYDWVIDDVVRSPFNEMNNTLFPNDVYGEYTGGAYGIDFLSNGFKPKTAYGQYNLSGADYIYFAFASQPFKFTNAR